MEAESGTGEWVWLAVVWLEPGNSISILAVHQGQGQVFFQAPHGSGVSHTPVAFGPSQGSWPSEVPRKCARLSRLISPSVAQTVQVDGSVEAQLCTLSQGSFNLLEHGPGPSQPHVVLLLQVPLEGRQMAPGSITCAVRTGSLQDRSQEYPLFQMCDIRVQSSFSLSPGQPLSQRQLVTRLPQQEGTGTHNPPTPGGSLGSARAS